MATLIVRNVDEEVKKRLAIRAAKHGRSIEAEVRDILKQATRERTCISEWLYRHPGFAGVDTKLPERSFPRVLDLVSLGTND